MLTFKNQLPRGDVFSTVPARNSISKSNIIDNDNVIELKKLSTNKIERKGKTFKFSKSPKKYDYLYKNVYCDTMYSPDNTISNMTNSRNCIKFEKIIGRDISTPKITSSNFNNIAQIFTKKNSKLSKPQKSKWNRLMRSYSNKKDHIDVYR